MGAFVGNVTSPFLRRRKGRVGRDVISALTAPTYGGANLWAAAGNGDRAVCAQTNIDRTYQHSNFGQSSWTGETLLDPNMRIGNGTPADSMIKMRPFNEYLDPDVWFLQNHFSAAGVHVTIGGALYEIRPDCRSNKQNFQVANAPVQAVAWSHDGRCFMTSGQPIAGACQARGQITDDTADAPLSLGYVYPNSVGGLGCQSLFAYQENADRYRYAFIGYHLPSSGVDTIKQLFRRKREGDIVNGNDLVSPFSGQQCGYWIQFQDKLMAFGGAVASMIFAFTSNLASWSTVATGNGGAIHGTWRYGRRIYVVSATAPRIRLSRNVGVAPWESSPAQPPDAGAVLDSVITNDLTGEIFLLAHDGAVNRMYRFRPYLEI